MDCYIIKYIQTMLDSYRQIKQAFGRVNEFKAGQDKFKSFSISIINRFIGAKIFSQGSTPQHMIFEKVLMFAIINKKHEKIKAGNKQAQNQLVKAIENNEAQILSRSKTTEQVFKLYIEKLIKCVNFIQDLNNLKFDSLIFYTVLSICKKQQQSFIWMKKAKYSYQDIAKLGNQFGQIIYYMDYDDDGYNKRISNQFQNGGPNGIYLLKAKQRYLILYAQDKNSSKGQMKITEAGRMSSMDVQKIFLKQKSYPLNQPISVNKIQSSTSLDINSINQNQKPYQNQIRLDTSLNGSVAHGPRQNYSQNSENISQSQLRQSKASSIRDSQKVEQTGRRSINQQSIIRPLKVKCSKCQAVLAEFDCVYWNYVYYCPSCLVDINVDTSQIPGPKINKFLKTRNLNNYTYELPCPECQHITKINNYNPAQKPKRYQCNLCYKTICVQHKANIYTCFCFCNKCNKQTIFLQKLKINFCQYCRTRYCFKCKQKRNQFCNCVCKYCLGEDSKTHECEPACHSCNNKPTKLRTCNCGFYICYGCYYNALDKYKQGEVFPCGYTQYV